ncbi:MAG: SDR family oxidoreductase [Pseudolabrys sp.]|nr:SDR family oxidoreductase [Pseudolabrys sp.]MDP2297169.1 SDR family oxidoreductase [Pseudolabrys sp.]
MSADSLKGLFDLSGQAALITGGSRGLGLQIAEALGEFGAAIVITARKQSELDEALAHLKQRGITASAVASDLGKDGSPAAVVDTVMERHGRLDILVNNAGTSWGAPAEDHPREAWDKLVALNLTAPFLLAQAAAKRAMIPAGRGRILNVASIEGLKGHPRHMPPTIAYNATKGGVINMTRALAAEWGAYGITVNAIAPGYFPSKMTSKVLDTFEADLVARTPRGRLGGPNDLKGAALLLASDASAHISGQILVVDGGASVI